MAARTPAAPAAPTAAPSRRAKLNTAPAADTATGSVGLDDTQKKLFRAKAMQGKRHGLSNDEANAAARAFVLYGTPLPFDAGTKAVAVTKVAKPSRAKAVAAPKAPRSARAPKAEKAVAPSRKRAAAVAVPAPAARRPAASRASAQSGDTWTVTNNRTLKTYITTVEPVV